MDPLIPSYSSSFLSKLQTKKEYYINRKDSSNPPICDDSLISPELQSQQKLIKNYINPDSPYQNLLVMWGTGVGKTLGAVSIAETFKPYIKNLIEKSPQTSSLNQPKIYIVSSNEARNNFIKELFSDFIHPPYITKTEREKLNTLFTNATTKESQLIYENYYKELLSRLTSSKKGGYYKFLGYTGFQNRTLGAKLRTDTKELLYTKEGSLRRKKSFNQIKNMDNSVLIIDEAHRIEGLDWAKAVELMIAKSKNLRVILLTATPMIDLPSEIIQILNLLLPVDKKIKKSDIFEKNNPFAFKPGALSLIGHRSQGYVSYLRGINPYTFPKRINIGKILTKFGFKFTHLIQCPMSKLQYNTYNKEITNKDSKAILMSGNRGVLDAVFPSPTSSTIGIFKNDDIDNLINQSQSYFNKYKIRVSKKDNTAIISGQILKLSNLINYSPKFVKATKNIIDSLTPLSGPVLIYNEKIAGIGLLLFKQILLENGFDVYNFNQSIEWNQNNAHPNTLCVLCKSLKKSKQHPSNHPYRPAKLVLLYGDTSLQQRLKIVSLINSPLNSQGTIIKAILGSRITSESIDFKRIREIHILNVQWNIPSIEQIIGRAVRHCSHQGLPKSQQVVSIFKYTSSLPPPHQNNPSIEEKIYLSAEKKHLAIKKIERVLKENAIDCNLNHPENVFPHEFKENNNTPICDYQNCNYKCAQSLPKNPSIDTSTYDLYYYHDEIKSIKKIIIALFSQDLFYTFEEIKNHVLKANKLFNTKYIIIALNELIINKATILNPFNYPGTITYTHNYYIFQPIDNTNKHISLMDRIIPQPQRISETVSLSNYITTITKQPSKQKMDELSSVISKINDTPNPISVSIIIGKLPIKLQRELLESALAINFYQTPPFPPYVQRVLTYFNDYLLTQEKLQSHNYQSSESISSSISKNPQALSTKPVAHIFAKNPKCIESPSNFSFCSKDFTKTTKPLPENNIIIGLIDKNKENKLVFKLRDPITTYYLDRRKIPRGYVCSQVNDKSKLLNIAKKLKITTTTSTSNIETLCASIEAKLRENEAEKLDNKKWFYEYIELLSLVN